MRIEDLCLLNQFIVAPADGIRLLIHDLVISELHIFSRELLSIMPVYTLSQKEGDFRFRAFLDLPGLCQLTHKVLQISIVLDQTVENKAVDIAGGRVLGEDRIEKGGIADRADDQLVDLLWRSRSDKDNIDYQKDEEEDGRNEKKGFDLQGRFPFVRVSLKIIIEEKLPLHNPPFNSESLGY